MKVTISHWCKGWPASYLDPHQACTHADSQKGGCIMLALYVYPDPSQINKGPEYEATGRV